MTYNVFGWRLNLAQSQIDMDCVRILGGII